MPKSLKRNYKKSQTRNYKKNTYKKSLKRKSLKRTSLKRKSLKRNRKTHRRKNMKRKSLRGGVLFEAEPHDPGASGLLDEIVEDRKLPGFKRKYRPSRRHGRPAPAPATISATTIFDDNARNLRRPRRQEIEGEGEGEVEDKSAFGTVDASLPWDRLHYTKEAEEALHETPGDEKWRESGVPWRKGPAHEVYAVPGLLEVAPYSGRYEDPKVEPPPKRQKLHLKGAPGGPESFTIDDYKQ
jgi:hypothetical protein